ncbi:MAG: cephalosporin hydroxylase [Pelagibacteraceae bacterium TMED65]|nr:MAG: cephalosporin hydroxylase [Pelagibacteraceae bacterium TMED65]
MVSKYSARLKELANQFFIESVKSNYSYNFKWLSRPIIQYPQDVVGVQEIIWDVKPDIIIETGIAHGGSLIFSASMLALLDYCEAIEHNKLLDPNKPNRRVIGVDIDIRKHNRDALDQHPLRNRLDLIEGSSIQTEIINRVKELAENEKKIMVFLDSNHTHEHVLAELQAYAPLVAKDSYCIAFDTVIEDLPDELCNEKPWGVGNNPKTAVEEFLKSNSDFIVDKTIEDKALITVAPNGFLKRIK